MRKRPSDQTYMCIIETNQPEISKMNLETHRRIKAEAEAIADSKLKHAKLMESRGRFSKSHTFLRGRPTRDEAFVYYIAC